jgi:membrane protein DedA with SNARE-associated domain
MDLQAIVQQTVDFVRNNQVWAAPIVFALAFGESLAFISLLIPAWGALVAIGALISSSDISFWPIWIAASLGAAAGDWLKKWGVPGIFIGRFFGPLRASVPLIAGIFEMPFWRFQVANFSSAFVWAAVLLTIGDVISKAVKWVW